MNQGKIIKDFPLEITLLPDYLSDENRTNIWLYTSPIYSYYPGLAPEKVDEMLKFEGHRHRIDVVGGFSVNFSKFSDELMGDYKPWLDGKAYTPTNGYWGPGQGVGEKTFVVGMYGTDVLGNTKEEIQHQSDLWVTWFKSNAPDVTKK